MTVFPEYDPNSRDKFNLPDSQRISPGGPPLTERTNLGDKTAQIGLRRLSQNDSQVSENRHRCKPMPSKGNAASNYFQKRLSGGQENEGIDDGTLMEFESKVHNDAPKDKAHVLEGQIKDILDKKKINEEDKKTLKELRSQLDKLPASDEIVILRNYLRPHIAKKLEVPFEEQLDQWKKLPKEKLKEKIKQLENQFRLHMDNTEKAALNELRRILRGK